MMTLGIQIVNELGYKQYKEEQSCVNVNELGYKQYKEEQSCVNILAAISVDLTCASNQSSMP